MTEDHGHVTARDITELLHHLSDLRHGRSQDPAERAAFLTRKAERGCPEFRGTSVAAR